MEALGGNTKHRQRRYEAPQEESSPLFNQAHPAESRCEARHGRASRKALGKSKPSGLSGACFVALENLAGLFWAFHVAVPITASCPLVEKTLASRRT